MADILDSLLTAGLGHFARGDDAAAMACWEEVLQQQPHHPRAAAYLTYARGIAPASPANLAAPVVDVLPPAASPQPSLPVEPVSFTPPPTAAPVTPSPVVDLSSSATAGRLAAVEPPTVTADTADWFQEASVATGSHPLNPGPEPTAPPQVALAEPDPLLAQVLQEMSATAKAPPATPPMNVTARGGALFGDAPPTPPTSPDGPWEAVMSPAPVGEPPRGAEVTNLDTPAQPVDANADGLQGMWAAPPTPAANAQAAVMSPWDEGPTVSSQIVMVDSEGTKTQRAPPSRGSPNTPVPGKNAPGPMAMSRTSRPGAPP